MKRYSPYKSVLRRSLLRPAQDSDITNRSLCGVSRDKFNAQPLLPESHFLCKSNPGWRLVFMPNQSISVIYRLFRFYADRYGRERRQTPDVS